MRPSVLSLFTGIGLHDLGLERAGFRIAAQVELDQYCRAVLERHWPEVTRFGDVRTVSADALRLAGVERIDLITGGFPCQDISVAGKGAGLDGKRSGLWHEMRRVVSDVRPDWVLAENVPALRTRGADRVLTDLAAIGYTCWPIVVGALHAGAPHRRLRVWIVAHRNGAELRLESGRSCREGWSEASEPGWSGAALADGHRDGREFERRGGLLDGERTARRDDVDGRGERRLGDANRSRLAILRGERAGRQRWPARPGQPQNDWEAPRLTERGLGRAVDGGSGRMDAAGAWRTVRALARRAARAAGLVEAFERRSRLRALGNANPPQVVEAIGRAILAAQRRMTEVEDAA